MTYQVNYANLPFDRKKKLKKYSDLKSMNPNSSHIYCNNLIDNYYPNRPNQLENMSLYEFASKYDFKSTPCILNDNHANCIKLEMSFGYMHYRNKIAVLKIPFIKPNCYMNQEKYFYQLLLLFKPWRNELNDIYNQSKHLNFKCMFLNEFENQLYNNLFLNEFIDATLFIMIDRSGYFMS